MEYHKGKYNTVPDALSKAPVNDYHSQPATCAVVLWFKRETTRNLQVMDMDIWKAQQKDPDVQSLYEKIMETGEVMVKTDHRVHRPGGQSIQGHYFTTKVSSKCMFHQPFVTKFSIITTTIPYLAILGGKRPTNVCKPLNTGLR